MAQNILGRGSSGDHGNSAAMRCKHSQNVALSPIIDRHDMMARMVLATIAALALPHRLVPFVGLPAGDFLGKVHPLETRPIDGSSVQSCDIDLSFRMERDGAVRRSEIADTPGQP